MTKLTLRIFKNGKKEGKGERKKQTSVLPVARCKRQTYMI
jgi:hypothetical protein